MRSTKVVAAGLACLLGFQAAAHCTDDALVRENLLEVATESGQIEACGGDAPLEHVLILARHVAASRHSGLWDQVSGSRTSAASELQTLASAAFVQAVNSPCGVGRRKLPQDAATVGDQDAIPTQ